MTIVHLDTALDWRGGQESLLTLARGLGARGHMQSIVSPSNSNLAERARLDGFPVLARCPRGVDIVHAHSAHAQNVAFWATLGSSVRRVVTRHVAFAPKHPFVHRLKYTLTCDGIIAVSDSVRRVLADAGVPTGRIEIIHTGIEMPASIHGHPATEDFVIGHMGAFTAEKGQDVALEAALLLKETLPRARMILAGDGPLLKQIRSRAPGRVLLPGFVSDRSAFFASLDLFIMPSRSEGWGLAAIEAMAHGVPVIASDIGGLSEIVQPGSGWLVPSGDPAALARAITVAASDPERLRATGATARERARLFSVERMAQQTEAFYRRLLDKSTG